MKVLTRDLGVPGHQPGRAGSRITVVLIGLSLAAYVGALVLPNFEACYFSCSTLVGYEWAFGTTFGIPLITVVLVLAHASFWVAAAFLLRGLRRRWVAIALLPYAAFCGWLVWVLLEYPDFFHLMIGWWLWFAAIALLISAILATRSAARERASLT